MRWASTVAARLEDWTAARAVGSTSQPSGPETSAPDSTNPRSTAAAMNGLPSDRRAVTSRATSGTVPAIEAARSATSPSDSGDSDSRARASSRRITDSTPSSSLR